MTKNFRPIFLLSVFTKLLERIIRDQLTKIMYYQTASSAVLGDQVNYRMHFKFEYEYSISKVFFFLVRHRHTTTTSTSRVRILR